MPLTDLGFMLDSFSGRIKEERTRQYDQAKLDDEREWNLLETLARYGNPEAQAMAGTAMLEMARGTKGRPRAAKGMRGFMGEVERSSYFPAVSEFLQMPRETQRPPASPGAGALPAGSPVEPGSQPMGPMVGAPPEPQVGPGQTVRSPILPGSQFEAPMAPPEPLASAPGPGMAPMTAPPEPKMRSLFPTAEELAITNARASITGRGQAIREQILAAGGTEQDVVDALRGIAGAPRRQGTAVPMMITYVDPATGQQETGLGTYDATTQQYVVNGQSVQGLSAQRIPSTVPRGPNARLVRDEASGTYVWVTPPTGTPGTPGSSGIPPSVSTGVSFPPPAEPPATSGTVTVMGPDGKPRVYERNREGGLGRELGTPPPTAGTAKNTDQARAAQEVVKEIEKRVGIATKATKDRFGRTVPGKARNKELQDQITREVLREHTGQDWPNATYAEITQEAAGLLPQGRTKSGITSEEMQKILEQLNKLTTGGGAPPSGQVRGSGLPPEPR